MMVIALDYDVTKKRYIEYKYTIVSLEIGRYITVVDIIPYPTTRDSIVRIPKDRKIFYLDNKDKTLLSRYLTSKGYIKDNKTGIWYIEKNKNKGVSRDGSRYKRRNNIRGLEDNTSF